MVSILIFDFRIKHLMIEALLFSNKDYDFSIFLAIKMFWFRMTVTLLFCNETEIINPEIRKILRTDIIFSILLRIHQNIIRNIYVF